MQETRLVKVKRNVVTSLLQNFLNIFISFVSRIIFVRILDASYLGINGLFSNILNILSMADLGMVTAMMYNLYKPIKDQDEETISSLISFFKRIYLIIACCILCIGISLTPFLKHIVNLENDIPHMELYYILALLNIVISYLFVYRTTLVSADQKNYVLNKYIMIFKLITFVAQTVALVIYKNYFIYLSVALIISLISNIYQNTVVLKMYPYLNNKANKLPIEKKNKIYKEVKALFLYKISGTIQSNTDNILISIFVGTIFVGYYSNYSLIIAQIIMMINLIFNSIKSSVANFLVSEGVSKEQEKFFFNVLEVINFWIVGFASISFIVLFQDFIMIAFGEQYLLSTIVVIAIVLNFYTSNIRQTIWVFREATGIFEETKFITAITAIINLILSLIMGYFWGMAGVIYATVLSRMIYAWWKEPTILYGLYFKLSSKEYFVNYIKRIIICAITCILTYTFSKAFFFENIYFNFIMKITVCFITPNVMFYLVFYKTTEFKYIKEKLIDSVIKRK